MPLCANRDLTHRSKKRRYSITSSARASSDGSTTNSKQRKSDFENIALAGRWSDRGLTERDKHRGERKYRFCDRYRCLFPE
jgi:hypothetical protein